MQDILTQSGCFIAIIVLGFVLRRIGFFKESDFSVLSKIALRITLPAAVITSFSEQTFDPSMLAVTLIAIVSGVIYMIIGFVINLRGSREQCAFDVLNLAGYNIGNFTLPFVRGFLGSVGAVTTCLFDVGNALICLGGSFGIASSIKDGSGFSLKHLLRTLLTSVPFITYIVMVTLNLCKIQLPKPVVSCAQIAGNANAFIAMLMIGVGFKLSGGKSQAGYIIKILVLRYSVAAALALVCYFLLPFSVEVRQTLVILAFGPIASAVPAFTGEMKGDVGLSSALNSISIVCSIVFIVTLLIVMLP